MMSSTLGVLDYLILASTLVVFLCLGVYYSWKSKKNPSTDNYLTGGKTMGVLPVSLSLVATCVSPTIILGFPIEIYTRGTQMCAAILMIIFGGMLAAEFFLPIFYKMNLLSINKYLFERYKSNSLRCVASISAVLVLLPFLGIILYAPALALGATTGLSVNTSILLIGLICIFYTTLGGMKAVIWTDVAQLVLITFSLIPIVIKGTTDAGGFNEILRRSSLGNKLNFLDFRWDIYQPTFWTIFLGFATLYTAIFSTNQMQVQRCCNMPTLKKGKIVLYLGTLGLTFIYILVSYTGLAVYANFWKCDPIRNKDIERPDQLIPYYVVNSFGESFPGFAGLFVTGVFSSSLSTISSGLNAVSALIWDDFVKNRVKFSESKSIYITKSIIIIYGILCIVSAFISSKFGTIFQAQAALTGAAMGPLFALFVLGIFCPFANNYGALAGLISGELLCAWIVIGAILNKPPPMGFNTSIEDCNIPLNGTRATYEYLTAKNIPNDSHDGLNSLYHISLFLLPLIGFVVSCIVGIIVSLITGSNRGNDLNPDLLNKYSYKLYKHFNSDEENHRSVHLQKI